MHCSNSWCATSAARRRLRNGGRGHKARHWEGASHPTCCFTYHRLLGTSWEGACLGFMLTQPFRVRLLRAQDALQRLRREGLPPGQALAQRRRTWRLCAFQLAGKGARVLAGRNAHGQGLQKAGPCCSCEAGQSQSAGIELSCTPLAAVICTSPPALHPAYLPCALPYTTAEAAWLDGAAQQPPAWRFGRRADRDLLHHVRPQH